MTLTRTIGLDPVLTFTEDGRTYRIVRTADIRWMRGTISRTTRARFPFMLLDSADTVINGVTAADLQAHYCAKFGAAAPIVELASAIDAAPKVAEAPFTLTADAAPDAPIRQPDLFRENR